MTARVLRWGVLGNAKIAREKVIPAMQQSSQCSVDAIASRDEATVADVARRLGIARTYGSYEDLLTDPDIDAVYIPLPNHLHVPWSIKTLESGKHVLCEKPIGLDADDAQQLLDASRNYPDLHVAEAFMYRFHPQWLRAKELVQEGAIGTLRSVNSVFSYHNVAPENIRNRVDAGGGALMDIGCYGISVGRYLFDSEPRSVKGTMQLDPDFGTDRLTSAVMEFDDGTATVTCATQMIPYQRVHVFGTEGFIEIMIPFNAPPDEPCRIVLQRGKDVQEIQTEAVDQYTLQGDAFARAVFDKSDGPHPLEDAVANMKAIDALRESAGVSLPSNPR